MDKVKNKGKLLFVPSGGLGNRMRAILSAVQLCETTGTDLQMLWFKDWGMGAAYRDIFKPVAGCPVRDANWIDCLTLDRPRKHNLFVPRLFQDILFSQRIDEYEVTPLKRQGFDFCKWAAGKSSYMSCYQEFGEIDNNMYSQIFKPSDELQQRVRTALSALGDNPIGIHIRRTDNRVSIEKSPVALFVDVMDALLSENPSQRFYLATDDEPTKELMRDRYGASVMSSASKAERGTVEGIKDAVAEMFTLAGCTRIYGTADSSFSVIASRIGDIQLTVLER